MSHKGEPKPYQYRNLTYVDHKPAFLANAYAALSGSRSQSDSQGDTEVLDPSRPAIPIRPREDVDGPVVVEDSGGGGGADKGKRRSVEDDGEGEDEDEGDEAPVVVVLKEGRHLTKEQAEEERTRARERPGEVGSAPSSKKPSIKPSLNFASAAYSNGDSSSRKRRVVAVDETSLFDGEEDASQSLGGKLGTKDDWTSMVKRVKGTGNGGGQSMEEGVKQAIEKAQKDAGTSRSKAEVEREERERREAKRRKKDERKAKEKKARGLMSFEE